MYLYIFIHHIYDTIGKHVRELSCLMGYFHHLQLE